MDFDPKTGAADLKAIGGSGSDQWNHVIGAQTVSALWLNHSDAKEQNKRFKAALAGLMGIAPLDELRGGGRGKPPSGLDH